MYSISYNIPAEVRGKYARPASNVSRVTSEADLKVTEHPLLSRPVTAGSLVRKSFVDAAMQVNLSRPSTSRSQTFLQQRAPIAVGIKQLGKVSRPQTAGSKRSFLHREAHTQPPLPAEVMAKVTELQESLTNEEPIVTEPVNNEAAPDVQDEGLPEEAEEHVEPLEISRPATATTWKTTSSQRRYIEELEKLLKEERKVSPTQRRVLAEAKLTVALPSS